MKTRLSSTSASLELYEKASEETKLILLTFKKKEIEDVQFKTRSLCDNLEKLKERKSVIETERESLSKALERQELAVKAVEQSLREHGKSTNPIN